MRLNVSVLDELVREYCVYRGIVDPAMPASGSGLPPSSGHLKANGPDAGCSSKNGSVDVDGNSKNSDDESSISNALIDGSEISTDMIRLRDTDVEMRLPAESTSNLDDCSTSGPQQAKSLRVCQKNRIHAVGESRRRKRWRGRNDDVDFPTNVRFENNKLEGIGKHTSLDMIHDKKCETVLGIKELASRGMAAEVVEEVNAVDPEFFGQNSVLLFQLKQVEFLNFWELELQSVISFGRD